MHTKDRMRWRIAQEAARIVAEEGIHDYLPAKQKAAARLGLSASRNLPRNEEIDAALDEHHRLFRAGIQAQHLMRLRTIALEAMRFLCDFSPVLVGSVLEGNAGEFSPITLHLFPDTTEAAMGKLMEGGIPFREKSVSASTGPSGSVAQPALSFFVDGVEVQLTLLPPEARLTQRDKTIARGDERAVEALIGQQNHSLASRCS